MPSAPNVSRGFSPLDAELGLSPSHYSPQLLGLLARLGTSMSFRQAATVLLAFSGVRVSASTAQRQTQAAGGRLLQAQAQEAAQVQAGAPPTNAQPISGTLLLSVDGAMVSLRGKQWAEVRTMAVGEVQSKAQQDGQVVAHTTSLSYYSRLCNAEQFSEQVWTELARRGIEQAARVVSVNDGAEWIQGLLDLNWVDAVRILDYSHAAQHLAGAGSAVLGEGSAAFTQWYAQQGEELKHGDAATVIAALRQLGNGSAVNEAVNYLEKRVGQMAYAKYQAQGYPIGSGSVESANKLVVEARLKGAGMHWARANVNPMLSLRNAECSGNWEQGWVLQMTQLGKRRSKRRGKVGADAIATQVSGRVNEPQVESATVRTVAARASAGQVGLVADRCADTTAAACGEPAKEAHKGQRRPAANHPWRDDPIGKARFRPRPHLN